MITKINFVFFTILILSVCILAQTKEQNAECNEKCRIHLNEHIVDEAKKLNLAVDLTRIVITSTPNFTIAFVPVETSEDLTIENLKKATVIGLYYIKPTNNKNMLDGFFRLQLSKQERKIAKEKLRLTTIKVALLDVNGKSVRENILSQVGPINVAGIVRPVNCWVGGTHGACFPSNTPLMTIRFWAFLCEDGCPIGPNDV